jgi:hypothetical protein
MLGRNRCYFICDNEPRKYFRFEVPKAMTMKSTAFCNIMPCSPLEVHRRFGGTYCLHIQGQRVSQARKQQEARSALLVVGNMFLRNVGGLHGVASQNTVVFIT